MHILKSKFRKSFVSIMIIILSSFTVITIIAVNNFNSQIMHSNQRSQIEKQVYYNAYAGLQKAIFEIRQNKDTSYSEYFVIGENQESVSPQNQEFYTKLIVSTTPSGNIYQYQIISTGYGSYKQNIIEKTITAKITVDYSVKTGIIRVDSINIQ